MAKSDVPILRFADADADAQGVVARYVEVPE